MDRLNMVIVFSHCLKQSQYYSVYINKWETLSKDAVVFSDWAYDSSVSQFKCQEENMVLLWLFYTTKTRLSETLQSINKEAA